MISDEKTKEYSAALLVRNLFTGVTVTYAAACIKNLSISNGLITLIGTIASTIGEKFQRASKRELEALLLHERSSVPDHS